MPLGWRFGSTADAGLIEHRRESLSDQRMPPFRAGRPLTPCLRPTRRLGRRARLATTSATLTSQGCGDPLRRLRTHNDNSGLGRTCVASAHKDAPNELTTTPTLLLSCSVGMTGLNGGSVGRARLTSESSRAYQSVSHCATVSV